MRLTLSEIYSMINARKLPRHTHTYKHTHTHLTHTPHTWLRLVLVFWFLWRIGNYCNIFGKFLCNRKVAAKEIASQLPLDGLLGAMTQPPHVAATSTSTSQSASLSLPTSTSTSSHSANWLRLCDAVVAFTLLWRLFIFILRFLLPFSVFGSCHSPLPHATLSGACHTLSHANTHANETSAAVSTRSMLCFGQVNRFFWQWAKTNDLGNELEIDFDTICHCN